MATCGFFTLGIILGIFADSIQNSVSGWMYTTLNILSYFFVFGSFGWSLLHPFIVYSETNKQWKNHWYWIILGTVPICYGLFRLLYLYLTFN